MTGVAFSSASAEPRESATMLQAITKYQVSNHSGRISTSEPQIRGTIPKAIALGFERQDDADDEAEERCTFQKRRDGDHAGAHLAGNFGLTGHALQSGCADLAEADACSDKGQRTTQATTDGRTIESARAR